MTDEAKALVAPDMIDLFRIIRRAGRSDRAKAEALADFMQLIETQAREIERLNAILSAMNDTDVIARTMAENERLREALHEIDIEAANTIPPDGKDAAFAALFRIAQIINPFRLPRAALAGDSHDQ